MSELNFCKYDGTPHYRFEVQEISSAKSQKWLRSQAGTSLYKGPTLVGALPNAALHHVALNQPYQCSWIFRRQSDGCLELAEMYVNLILPLRDLASPITDMDLDVVVSSNGPARLVDRDEYEANKVKMRYPPATCELIESAARLLTVELSHPCDPCTRIPEHVMATWRGYEPEKGPLA